MEMNKYIQPGKSVLAENKRIERQTNEYLASIRKEKREAEILAEQTKRDSALSAARFSYASGIARSKNRVRNLQEELQYTEKISVIGMTKVLSTIVENALLMDLDEFAVLNPSYKETINEMVKSFLENGNINSKITNAHTLSLMEYVARTAPEIETGKYLTEEELSNSFETSSPEETEAAIRALSDSVKKKIAKLIGKEQKKTQELQDEIDQLTALTAPEVPVEEAPVEGEEQLPAEGEVAVDPATGEEIVSPAPVELGNGKKLHITLSLGEQFYRDHGRENLLETLATNEALTMIKEGKEYNSDLAIGNALIYMTILETFNCSGLMPVTDADYKRVIKNAGGNTDAAAMKIASHSFKKEDAAEETRSQEDKKEEYTDSELTVKLEKEGYDFSVDNLAEIAENNGYRKSEGKWTKK